MLTAIKLNNQPSIKANEIGNVFANGNLATKLEAFKLPPTKRGPKFPLNIF